MTTEVRPAEADRCNVRRCVVENLETNLIRSDFERLAEVVSGEQNDDGAVTITRSYPAAETVIARVAHGSDEPRGQIAGDIVRRAVCLPQQVDGACVGVGNARSEADLCCRLGRGHFDTGRGDEKRGYCQNAMSHLVLLIEGCR